MGRVQSVYIKRRIPLSEEVQPRSVGGERKPARGHGFGNDGGPRERLGALPHEVDARKTIQRLPERIGDGRSGRYRLSFQVARPDRADDLLRLVALVDSDVAIRGNAADAKPRMPEFDPHLVRGRCDRLSRMGPAVQRAWRDEQAEGGFDRGLAVVRLARLGAAKHEPRRQLRRHQSDAAAIRAHCMAGCGARIDDRYLARAGPQVVHRLRRSDQRSCRDGLFSR